VNDDCLKLTIYFGERDRTDRGFLADDLVDIFARHELATSLVMRGTSGFGAKHQLRTDRLLTLSEDLPIISVAVGHRECIEKALHQVEQLRFDGLVTLERARMLTEPLDAAELPPDLEAATKLTVYVGRQEPRDRGRPTKPWLTFSTAAASPARPSCSASTAPPTASANGRGSSDATPTSR
jgi:PII-like signaling protein